MTNYKPVKIMFDLDDEYQAQLYQHLKNRTNSSSYVRTLIHQDLFRGGLESMTEATPPPIYEIVNEQKGIIDEQKKLVSDNSIKATSVRTIVQQPIKINVNNVPIEPDETDFELDGLI